MTVATYEGGTMANCISCGHELVWQNDFDFEDYGCEGDGIVSVWYCPNCGAMHEVYISCGETETE